MATKSSDIDLSILRHQRKVSVDAWLENFMRRHATLASPASPMGPQMDNLIRLSTDSNGKQLPSKSGLEIPCRDDSPAHSAAHRADRRLADHSADMLVWFALSDVQRQILVLQRSPIPCPGSGDRPKKPHRKDDVPRCGGCERPANDVTLTDDGVLRPHRRCVPIIQERPATFWREGDGSEHICMVKDADGNVTNIARRRVWEPVARQLDDIAELVHLSERQVRTQISKARAAIAEKIFEMEGAESARHMSPGIEAAIHAERIMKRRKSDAPINAKDEELIATMTNMGAKMDLIRQMLEDQKKGRE